MFKNIFLIVVITLLIAGCAKTPNPPSPSQKVFEGEDLYILYALRAEEVGRFDMAAKLYARLYEKARKKEYLYKELHSLLAAGEYESVVKKVDAILHSKEQKDPNLLRLKVIALLHLNKVQEAKKEALLLVGMTKKSEDYLLLADIYVKLKKYDMAVKYLEGAYSKNYDEKILDRISIILFMNLQKQKEAIAQLETHSRMFGCSERICKRLLSFYSKLGDVDGMLSVYKRMYKQNQSDEILAKIIQLYIYKKEYMALERFLEHYNVRKDVLLELYATTLNYKKAYKTAYELYKETQNPDYLAQGAIYEYESLKHPNKQELQNIIQKLEKAIKQKQSPVYLNYLGYLLIDHDIDVKRGMELVKKALKSAPNSAFYLDSLAWGYYKLGACKKAKKIFDKIRTLKGGDDPEVLKHYKKVKQCLAKKALKKGAQ